MTTVHKELFKLQWHCSSKSPILYVPLRKIFLTFFNLIISYSSVFLGWMCNREETSKALRRKLICNFLEKVQGFANYFYAINYNYYFSQFLVQLIAFSRNWDNNVIQLSLFFTITHYQNLKVWLHYYFTERRRMGHEVLFKVQFWMTWRLNSKAAAFIFNCLHSTEVVAYQPVLQQPWG